VLYKFNYSVYFYNKKIVFLFIKIQFSVVIVLSHVVTTTLTSLSELLLVTLLLIWAWLTWRWAMTRLVLEPSSHVATATIVPLVSSTTHVGLRRGILVILLLLPLIKVSGLHSTLVEVVIGRMLLMLASTLHALVVAHSLIELLALVLLLLSTRASLVIASLVSTTVTTKVSTSL